MVVFCVSSDISKSHPHFLTVSFDHTTWFTKHKNYVIGYQKPLCMCENLWLHFLVSMTTQSNFAIKVEGSYNTTNRPFQKIPSSPPTLAL